jgi:hypothetical protein
MNGKIKKTIRRTVSILTIPAIILVLFSGVVMAKNAAYGDVIGDYGGVEAHSNGDCTAIYTGKCANLPVYNHWQCVEYVNRFYEIAMGVKEAKDWSGNGATYYPQPQKGIDGVTGLDHYDNGGSTPPQQDDLLAFSGGIVGYGHVAIITEVGSDYVRVIEQNWARNDAIDGLKHLIGRYPLY